ncbi:preprotein translocase subunit SecE [Haploplasma axanthum]|uniref:Preprotein translocase subunit SecE n=1 Tax=Haploplasma axanthum TaxID=29552 RepID=A0A449BCN4_HAPAX|nr:preprotein translocase subunit SecE [Haploplasma axanthum]VEU80188.1 preprotein translocase subunit SecE [Haploplasma axanthum]
MAVKEKTVEKKSKLKEILVTEYRWENLLLLVLATLSTALSLIIIINKGPITIDSNFPVLGNRTNQLIFAWILFAISMMGIGLVIAPFITPAIPELKKITWATKSQFLDHSVRVLVFILFFVFVIIAFDIIVLALLNLINGGL